MLLSLRKEPWSFLWKAGTQLGEAVLMFALWSSTLPASWPSGLTMWLKIVAVLLAMLCTLDVALNLVMFALWWPAHVRHAERGT